MQVFYEEFGELMMEQPVIGLDFQTWLPVAIVPYILLLSLTSSTGGQSVPVQRMCAVQMCSIRTWPSEPVPAC